MLLRQFPKLDRIPSNSVITFIGFVNFLKIPNKLIDNLYWLVDGQLLNKMTRITLGVSTEISCFDFSGIANDVILWAIESNFKILFVGGTSYENGRFLEIIRNKYSNLICDGLNGYSELEKLKYLEANEFDIVVYGLGAPLQEVTADENKMKFRLSFTCGAFITQTSKNEGEYYPNFYHRFRLRWLYRSLKEKGHFLRILKALTKINSIRKKLKLVQLSEFN